jgi:radical SAM protein with 4Fe4S-binding SPASM domain
MSRETVKTAPPQAAGSGIYAGLRTNILDPVRWEAYNTPDYRTYRERFESAYLDRRPGDFPIHLEVEATDDCNLTCPFCLRTQRVKRGELADVNRIDPEVFGQIIDRGVSLGLASLKFGFQGESLLHPDLPAMTARAKDSGLAEVMINTNGTLLDHDLGQRLVEAGMDRIIFSIDSHDPQKFARLRPGADLEKIIENIKALRESRGDRVTPIIQVQGLLLNLKEIEPQEFIDFWRGLAEVVSFSDVIDYVHPEENLPGDGFVCPEPFQKLVLWSDGALSPCCADVHRRFRLGNAYEISPAEVWNGPAMTHIRRTHANGRAADFPACRACWRMKL